MNKSKKVIEKLIPIVLILMSIDIFFSENNNFHFSGGGSISFDKNGKYLFIISNILMAVGFYNLFSNIRFYKIASLFSSFSILCYLYLTEY